MNQLLHDLRFALRQLQKAPGFTLTVVITLALGIGANTAIFTLVQGILLRSLPVSDPSRLYRIGDTDDCCVEGGIPSGDNGDFSIFSTDLYQYLRNNDDAKTKMAIIAKDFAPCEKEYTEDYFSLIRSFGPHTLSYFTSRSAVCTAKVVGKKMVEARPSSYFPEVPAHEEDIIEWECSPLLEITDKIG